MANSREDAFKRRLPEFTDNQAKTFFDLHGGEVVSVWGRRGVPDYLVLAFATETETFGPIALNPIAVEALRKLLGG